MNKTTENIRIINEHQQDHYEYSEMVAVQYQLNACSAILTEMKTRNALRFLDIGGASGILALELRKIFPDKNCEIVVLDSTQYKNWERDADKITFVQGSAIDLTKLFDCGTFDLIFANNVFHHFVCSSYGKTRTEQKAIMQQVAAVLKHNGKLFIHDWFYDGMIHDQTASRILYALTTPSFPPLVKICKMLGSHSAGVGVCFLSKKMWLDLFASANLGVESSEYGEKNPFSLQNLCLLIKNQSWDNIFVVKKKE
jgi:SAM-dependent methyltransferase